MKECIYLIKITLGVVTILMATSLMAQVRHTEPIPEEIVEEIKYRTRASILSFKMRLNPNITEEDYRVDPQTIKDPKYVLLNDTAGKYTDFELMLDVERLSPFKSELWDNFYKVTKKGNRFVNVEEYATKVDGMYVFTEAYKDTVEFDLGSQYFPFDELFVVYYDTTGLGAWALVSGNFDRYPMYGNYFPRVDLDRWASVRVYQYGATNLHDFRYYADRFNHHSKLGEENLEQGYRLFVGDSKIIKTKQVLVRVPKKSPYEPIELFYYTNDTIYTGLGKYDWGKSIAKVTYTINSRPKSYEELQPKVEVLSGEKKQKVFGDSNFRERFFEFKQFGYFRKEEIELEHPIDTIYFDYENGIIIVVDESGEKISLGDELEVRYEIKVKGQLAAIITEDKRKIIYK